MPGLLIAAPSSGSGKTTVTLGILRALSRRGIAVRGAKSGPDYIDPRFHEAACGVACFNLDAWAMGAERLKALAGGAETLVVEGAMGLFDGAPPDGRGASADLARQLGLPVVLVVDAGRMAQSVAPLVAGFAGFDPKVRIGGVVLNRVGSPRHEGMLRRALERIGPLSIAALLLTLVLLFAFQGEAIIRQPLVIAMLAVPILIQVFFNSGLAYWLNRKAGEQHSIACPSALIGASNFFELAVAAAISLFGFQSGAALATVVGVLIEVPVMLLVVRIVNQSKGWYECGPNPARG